MLSETLTQSSDFCRTRPSFLMSLKRKADHKCGFNEFRRKFPELCDASSTVLNSPQTPSSPHIQLPNFNEPNRMSGSVLSQPTFNLKGSSEGSAPDAPVTQILEHVFLGSQEDSQNPATLKRFNITKVINLSDCPKSDLIPSQNFMRIAIKDSHDAKICPYFDQAYDFIEEARRTNQRVLVHCLAGISRSPTLCIAYMMRAKAWTFDVAYKYVKARRSSVSPNMNFVGQLFLYENHLRERGILPPCVRPRSNVIDEFNPPLCKEQVQMSAPRPVQPTLIMEKLCKSASADFSVLSHDPAVESRKRIMDTPLSLLPCRPRQLIKNCCARKNLDEPPQLPSPSSEFSKLDISLSNPCFGTLGSITPDHQVQPQTSTQINAENPVFGLVSSEERAKTTDSKSTSNKKPASRHHLFALLARRSGECKILSAKRCKLRQRINNSPLITEESPRPVFEGVRFRPNQQRFNRLPTRTPVNIMPTLPDDDSLDSGKGTSISHSVSTEDGESHEQSEGHIASSTNAEDPEKDSISSASSLEITVQ